MDKAKASIIGMAALAAILLWPRRASAGESGIYFDPITDQALDDVPMGDVTGSVFDDPELIQWYSQPDTGVDAVSDPVAAFLYMIRSCEHLYPRDVVDTDAAYRTFYGGSRFSDMSDHPVATGEKKGVPLPPAMCRAAGFAGGVCVSTAAGAYQITLPTWREFRQAGAWGPRLPDFSAESQDEAARRILQRIGALRLIEAGDIEAAIKKASARWASLPGSTAQQHPKPLEFALARYNEAGFA